MQGGIGMTARQRSYHVAVRRRLMGRMYEILQRRKAIVAVLADGASVHSAGQLTLGARNFMKAMQVLSTALPEFSLGPSSPSPKLDLATCSCIF